LFFEWYTIDIVKKPPTRNILQCFCIYKTIWYKYDLSGELRHLGIVECDLFYKSLICTIRFQLYTDDLTYIECSR
jgi:hypothetical protein